MAKIETEGAFNARIVRAYKVEPGYGYHNNEENKKNDPNAFAIMLVMETPDSMELPEHYMQFTKRVITKGRDAGKTEYEAAEAKLAELGVGDDGYVGTFAKMMSAGQTIEVNVKTEFRTYTDNKTQEQKRRLESKYLNPPRKEMNIKDVDFDALLGKKSSGAPKSPTKPTVAAPAVVEDATFNPEEFEAEVEAEASPI